MRHAPLLDEQAKRSQDQSEKGVHRNIIADLTRLYRLFEMREHDLVMALHHSEKDLLHFGIALEQFFRKDRYTSTDDVLQTSFPRAPKAPANSLFEISTFTSFLLIPQKCGAVAV